MGQGPTSSAGGGSNDELKGQGGNDRIFGGIGDDALFGGAGNDVLDGGPGTDVEEGDNGNDTLRGGQGSDKLLGGDGTNTASFADALPPGFVEVEKGEEEEGKGRSAHRVRAEGFGIEGFPVPGESGVYINLSKQKVYGGKLGEGAGIDTIKGIQHIVGSPFSDWIEGTGEATEVDPGPGDDAIFAAGGAQVLTGPGDWIDGSRVSPSARDRSKIEIGSYGGGLEKNVYVIGSTEDDGLTANPSGAAVKITANAATAARLPAQAPGCNPAGNGFSCPEGKRLGALALYGGQGNDAITMQSENQKLPGAIELDGGPQVDRLIGGREGELLVDGIQQGSGGREALKGGGGEDALAQGEGADLVEGGSRSDLVLNARICEGDALYAGKQGTPPPSGEIDNAQFHPLPDLGVYANLKRGKVGGDGKIKEVKYKHNCGTAKQAPLVGFNTFEGSPQNDLVFGNAHHNLIIGRGGENRLYGGGGNDTLHAKNTHPELKIDCGKKQPRDYAFVDGYDVDYLPGFKNTCRVGTKDVPVYSDNQQPGRINKSRPKPTKKGGGKAAAALSGWAPSGTGARSASPASVEEEAAALADQGLVEVPRALPTAEFHLDEIAGTSAENAIDEEAPGTYMAKGIGPSVNDPGPVLGAESALLGGEEGEEEGASISLNGLDAYVDLAGQAGPEKGEEGYSLSLYVKFANAPGQREYIFSSSEGGGEGAYLYRAADGSIVFTRSQVSGAPEISSEPVEGDGWHQLVASLGGQTISLNVDGFPYKLGYGSSVMPDLAAAPESLLGAGPGATDLLAGSLDEVVSYEGVLSEGEVLTQLATSKAQIAEYLPMSPPETADEDDDGVPDGVDNCPATSNPEQVDENADGIGDACQVLDEDEDGVPDSSDNCPTIYNPDQADENEDGLGDACSELPPVVSTGGASDVTPFGATLHATVNPGSQATSYRFEYGTTSAYGSVAPEGAAEPIGKGITQVAVSQTVTGLEPDTTYHCRVIATNAAGRSEGEDETFTTGSAMTTAEALAAMPSAEPFDGSTGSLEAFEDWSALGWSEGPAESRKGSDTPAGWRPLEAFPRAAGAAYPDSISDNGSGIATIAALAQNPTITEGYFSLWLAMPEPASATRAGYELRFTETAADTYTVRLTKWVAGNATALAAESGFSLAPGSRFAIVETEGVVSAWVDAGSGFTELLAAEDATLSEGQSGIEGAGSMTRLKDFATGALSTG